MQVDEGKMLSDRQIAIQQGAVSCLIKANYKKSSVADKRNFDFLYKHGS